MARLAEYAEAIERSNLELDKSELISILEEYAEYSGEQWHGQDCECSECRR